MKYAHWRKARMFLGFTVRDVATATGLTDQRLSLIERGLVQPNHCEEAGLREFLLSRLLSERGLLGDFLRERLGSKPGGHSMEIFTGELEVG
jgi:transcriptional regulator with XRE-family HTH domain